MGVATVSYCINLCRKYPIKNKEMIQLVQEILKMGCFCRGDFFLVNSKNFRYEDIDKYEILFNQKKVVKQMEKNTFYRLEFYFPNTEIEIQFDYLDEECYSIFLAISEEDWHKYSNWLLTNRILDMMLNLLQPIYGTAGIEAGIDSLKGLNSKNNPNCELDGDFYVAEMIYLCQKAANILPDSFLEILQIYYKIVDVKNGILLYLKKNIRKSEAFAQMLIQLFSYVREAEKLSV